MTSQSMLINLCEKFKSLIDEYILNELPKEQLDAFDEHLIACDKCKRLLNEENKFYQDIYEINKKEFLEFKLLYEEKLKNLTKNIILKIKDKQQILKDKESNLQDINNKKYNN